MRKEYRNTAFLLELLVNVLVFIIVCAVLLGVLANSRLIAQQTGDKTRAGNEMFAVLETVRARGQEALAAAQSPQADVFVLFYDEAWCACGEAEARYSLRLALQREDAAAGVLEHVQAVASTTGGEELLVMETSFYRPAA